jgi:transcriptional regulator with XRE-family HTH domain
MNQIAPNPTPTHTSDPVDVYVGDRIRARRKLLGQSQQALAEYLGVTFQQVQKYERGSNRISASMMNRAAIAQGVSVAYYFEGLNQSVPSLGPANPAEAWLMGSEAAVFAEVISALSPAMRVAALRAMRAWVEMERGA